MLKQLITLSKTDFHSRYAGNLLGALWAFVYPAVTVILYWLVFRVILKTGPVDDSPYILWLVSALAPYLFISESLFGAALSLPDYSYIARKSRMQLSLLPAARVLSCLFVHAAYLALLLLLRHSLAMSWLSLLLYIAAELAFTLSLGYILAVLTVFFRDIRNILPVLTQVGFWLTPIFWDSAAAPSPFGAILRLINPAAYVTEGFRSVFCGLAPPPVWYAVYFWLFVVSVGIISQWLFHGTKQRIVDFF